MAQTSVLALCQYAATLSREEGPNLFLQSKPLQNFHKFFQELNSKFWVFELTFLQKSISTRKQKKLSSPLNSECFNYSAYHTPVSKNNFQFWDQIRPKRVFCDGSKKIAHHHWVLHILTSLQSWTKYLEQNREVQ